MYTYACLFVFIASLVGYPCKKKLVKILEQKTEKEKQGVRSIKYHKKMQFGMAYEASLIMKEIKGNALHLKDWNILL